MSWLCGHSLVLTQNAAPFDKTWEPCIADIRVKKLPLLNFYCKGNITLRTFVSEEVLVTFFFVKELVFLESVLLKIVTIQELYITEGCLLSKKG